MDTKLSPGLRGEKEILVNHEISAASMGSGGLEVLATPAMIALLEGAAYELAQRHLPEGSSTVGTKVVVEHLAATPVGMKVIASAELLEVDGKRLVFSVEAKDEKQLVGRGTHERFIIDVERFLAKVNSKLE